MTQSTIETRPAVPQDSLITLTHVIYGLHAFSAITGITTAAFVATAFLTGWPSVIAVIINYVKRNEVRGTFLDSHFSWQIRTFWWALFWSMVAGFFIITLIGIVIGIPLLILVGLWVIYRIIRGWLALQSRQPMPI